MFRFFLIIFFLGFNFPVSVLTQLNCHRCFGNGYCNNGTHEDFIADQRFASCNVAVDFSESKIDHPILNKIQQAINDSNNNGMILESTNPTEDTPVREGNCITATVHEDHEIHTLRTCVTRTVPANSSLTICDQLEAVLNPMNLNKATFICNSCNNGHYCNNHTLLNIDSSSTPLIASFAVITVSFMALFYN